MISNKDAVSQAIVYLFEREMFYAEVIANMRRFNDKLTPIAGVCIKDYIELHINVERFEKFSLEERAAILKHECEHILRNHIFRMKELSPEVYNKTEDLSQNIINSIKHKAMNIAADCAVNSNINNLPDNCILPKQFDLPNGETLEWYLEQMKDNDKAKGLMEFDDHSLWAESEGSKELLKEKVKQAINKAAKRTRSVGRMTADNELLVSNLNKNLVNWKEQLKRFVARSIESTIESSKKRRNRRYGIMFPGTIKVEDLHIGVAIDTSGSVSDESLTQFMAEIENIAKYAKVTVVEADSSIKNHYEFKPKKSYSISGRGGTAYKPAFTWFTNNTNIDALIYFGDMDTSDAVTKPKYPVLWAIVGNSNPPATFGKAIRIKRMITRDKIEQQLLSLPHKLKVTFAMHCCNDVKQYMNKEAVKCLSLVELWLKDSSRVTNTELRIAADVANAAATNAASYAAATAAAYTAHAAAHAAAHAIDAVNAAYYAAYAAYYAANAVNADREGKLKQYYNDLLSMINNLTELEKEIYNLSFITINR